MPDSNRKRQDHFEALAAHIRARLGVDATVAGAAIEAYYGKLATEDLLARSPEALFGAALGHWRFAAERPAGTTKVRVFNPSLESHGWQSHHTVVETVTDDMPFLVDSIAMELARQGRSVHLLAHPILPVLRDQNGHALGLAPSGSGEGQNESLIHIEIDQDADPASRAALEATLARILANVRAAVTDWRTMLAQIDQAIAGLAGAPIPAADRDEQIAFLHWLAADNFVLLGTREYRYQAGAMVEAGGLGLLRDAAVHAMASGPGEQAVHHLTDQPGTIVITKSNMEATVHRRAIMDFIGVKAFDHGGAMIGEYRFYGLLTSTAYQLRPRDIPLVREKVRRVIARAGFAATSHDGKALSNVLESYPRDELFEIGEDELAEIATGILRLEERPRPRLFARAEAFGRWISALVFLPRDRFDTALRRQVEDILEKAAGGKVMARSSLISQAELARVHLIVRTDAEHLAQFDTAAAEAQIVRAARGWGDRLREALVEAHGEDIGLKRAKRWEAAFGAGYRETNAPETAVHDVDRMEPLVTQGGLGAIAQCAYRRLEDDPAILRFKLYRLSQSAPLSDVAPLLEHLGLKLMEEVPSSLSLPDGVVVWIHDFRLIEPQGRALDLDKDGPLVEEAFSEAWAGRLEDDRLNRLVLLADLSARDVTVLRAIAKYLRQIGIPFSQDYMEETLARYPTVAGDLVRLFHLRHDPALAGGREAAVEDLRKVILEALDAVVALDDDRILRRFLNVVEASLRTNLYQRDANGNARPALAIKLDSRSIDGLPLPKPLVEIWVYSPRVEGIHLRGGRVARGGLRWSDRKEDFRTEVLGLVKAQMVKNAVIVPTGSKGGFYPKRAPAEGGREAILADAIECYKIFVGSLLDLTDNIVGGATVPPRDIIRYDGDDPYLVVAADKGTATFSDIANGVAQERGFWLDDAFASGGSAGYDHKAMGITARGAWEAVKRHFRELGRDTQTTPFTVAGVGDMSGDVFGNGMLLSTEIRLIAAFDHRHIVIDPDPDPATSFAERRRLFALGRSSWADYNIALLSPGGGIFPRSQKTIPLSPEAQAALGLETDHITPPELIRAILAAAVDLLWFGGIGTYIKASTESQAEAGDRANDGVRIDARAVRAKVIGEGANLGVTQRGRIEYALAGGRINTDAIDNSAGVDCSDHEVNIKILLNGLVADGDMTRKQRDHLLREMTDTVAALVLRDNYLQTQSLSMIEARGVTALDQQQRLMRGLERDGKLNRDVEFLPSDGEIAARAKRNGCLTRPELAVLLAYAKIDLKDELLAGDAPEDPYLAAADLKRYFPPVLEERFADAITRHPLRREIIATQLANAVVNWVGPTFVSRMAEATGFDGSTIARVYAAARAIFDLRDLCAQVDALDGQIPAAAQSQMLLAVADTARQATMWLLHNEVQPIDIAATIDRYRPGIVDLRQALPGLLPERAAAAYGEALDTLTATGVPDALAGGIAALGPLAGGLDVVASAAAAGIVPVAMGAIYYAIGEPLGLDALREAGLALEPADHWERLAINAVVDDLYAQQRLLAAAAAKPGVEAWLAGNAVGVGRARVLAEEMTRGGTSLAKLTFAGRQLRGQFSV